MPRPQLYPKRLLIAVDDKILNKLDRWRAKQPGIPTRSESIRRLIDIGLKADEASSKPRGWEEMSAKRRRPWKQSISGPFAPRRIEMLESPAYRVLSLTGHRILARIEIEHARHGGNDNGKLPVTYEDFLRYGIGSRRFIAPGVREVEALGFIEITERGRAGNREFRTPSKYRLTYLHLERAAPTDEWRRIQTVEEAEAIARMARKARSRKHFSSAPLRTVSVPQRGTENVRSLVPQRGTTAPVPQRGTTIYISGTPSLAPTQPSTDEARAINDVQVELLKRAIAQQARQAVSPQGRTLVDGSVAILVRPTLPLTRVAGVQRLPDLNAYF